MVLLSHAHMDHLNRPSLRRIVALTLKMTGRAPIAVVPWGVEDLVSDLGFARVVTLEWWQTKSISGLEITMTPCKHWGARFFKDTHRGFGGYVIRGGGHTPLPLRDTAYFDGFAKIGERLKPEIALLPIGAYSPDSYRGVHTCPEEALQAFLDLGARQMIPMHYGTFRLSQEPMEEPVERLMAAARRAGVAGSVYVLPEGDTEVIRPIPVPVHHPPRRGQRLKQDYCAGAGSQLPPQLAQGLHHPPHHQNGRQEQRQRDARCGPGMLGGQPRDAHCGDVLGATQGNI